MSSISDLALLLTNAVFNLGLKPKSCNEETVVKNKNTQLAIGVKSSLENLRKFVKDYVEPRNLYIHRNQPPNLGKLDDLEGILFIERAKEKLSVSFEESEREISEELKMLMNPYITKLIYNSERKKIVKELKGKTDEVASLIIDFWDELHKIYSK